MVTEDTVEQKVVERAQQKLKLDAMVVQQGRLNEKDKLSSEELLDAIRFGADKIFKSKDSSITDDDIDLILDSGKRKTQELNDKLQAAEKGDLLDFKLDGGIATQTFEGIDYSEAKNAQFTQDLLSNMAMDVGKRERRTVAYNENQLYIQQMQQQGLQQPKKKKKAKKEIRLPKMLRLPRMEEFQMFDRDALNALQEVEEQAFRALPEEVQLAVGGTKAIKKQEEDQPPNVDASKDGTVKTEESKPEETVKSEDTVMKEEPKDDSEEKKKEVITLDTLPPLLSEDQANEKTRLLAEGFSDWSRHHFNAFVKASGKYGRTNYAKIANDVGKPVSAIQSYSEAFWDEDFGKKRFAANEYERHVKNVEKGEKKIGDIKGLQRGTKVLISLFENPWVELQFIHHKHTTKDNKFTAEEDRYLLCWAHKVRANAYHLCSVLCLVCHISCFSVVFIIYFSMAMAIGKQSSLLFVALVTLDLTTFSRVCILRSSVVDVST